MRRIKCPIQPTSNCPIPCCDLLRLGGFVPSVALVRRDFTLAHPSLVRETRSVKGACHRPVTSFPTHHVILSSLFLQEKRLIHARLHGRRLIQSPEQGEKLHLVFNVPAFVFLYSRVDAYSTVECAHFFRDCRIEAEQQHNSRRRAPIILRVLNSMCCMYIHTHMIVRRPVDEVSGRSVGRNLLT